MECGVVGQHYETPYFHSRHQHPPSWNGPAKSLGPIQPLPHKGRTFTTPAGANGVWPLLRPVSVTQKNKLSTMFSTNVQSIDLPMDCTAWRFCMKQSNGCSTPAPRSSAAKQWFCNSLKQDPTDANKSRDENYATETGHRCAGTNHRNDLLRLSVITAGIDKRFA